MRYLTLEKALEAWLALQPLSEDDKARDMATYPLKRYGTPQDVAYAFIYLLSDASSWVTGTSLIVDGGKLMR